MKTLRLLTILCATALLLAAPARAEFSWEIQHTGAVNAFFELESFHTFVTNTGTEPDTVLVNMVKEAPVEWSLSLCEEELCYPPFLLDIALELDPGQTIELIIDITPTTVDGTGRSHITLTSSTDPGQVAAQTFSVITPGLDVLLVDTAGNGAGALVGDALTTAGMEYGVWDVSDMGKATPADLAAFPAVVWTAGGLLTALDTADMTALESYVLGGGHLLLSGQNLLFAYADPISPFYDVTARDWFRRVMGADYVANIGSTTSVSAPGGAPVFGGAFYDLNGGDGSNDNISPDVMTPWGGAAGSLVYDGGGEALTWNVYGTGKVVMAGFGIESLATAPERADFMARTLGFFAAGASGVGEPPAASVAARAWPNPFNPQTTIRFEVGGDRALPVTVDIVDVAGRIVRRLRDDRTGPGPQQVTWDGRDDAGRHLATGVYLARIRVGESREVVKLALVK